jgi:hypothetical protein
VWTTHLETNIQSKFTLQTFHVITDKLWGTGEESVTSFTHCNPFLQGHFGDQVVVLQPLYLALRKCHCQSD